MRRETRAATVCTQGISQWSPALTTLSNLPHRSTTPALWDNGARRVGGAR